MAKLPPFLARCFGVIAKKGLYQGDTGVIMIDTSSDYSSECVVAFLPRLDLPQQKFKRVKKTHSSNPAVPATFTTPFPVSTTMSDIKSKFDFVSINTKAGYPIPLERTVPSKKRSVPSARRPRSIKSATCEHGDKEYALLKQTIWQGLSLVRQKVTNLTLANTIAEEDLLEFFETESTVLQSNIPLPSTWIFGLGERVRVSNRLRDHHRPLRENPELASELGLQSKDEGFIRDVVEINCVVEFLDGTDGEGRQVVLPQHSLLKVMRQGDEVYVRQASRSIFQLGVAEVSSTTERIPLDGKVGLVVSVGDDGETVQVQFSEYPVPQQFHSNSLVNSALMLSSNDLVKRGIKKPLPSIDPVFSIVPKTLVYVEPNPSILTTDPAPEPLDLAIRTGRRPWVGKEVRIVGLNDRGATIKHHKAENGSVLDVNRNDSMSSGLAITVSRVRRFDDGKFLHDNGPHKLPTYDPHFHFKPGYQPQYTQSEILKGYAPMDMSAWQATYQDRWVGSGGNNGGTEGGIDEMQASSSSFDSGPASGSTTRSIASGFASPDGCMSPDSSLNSLLQPYKCWWVDVPGTITRTPLRLVPATPFPDFTNEILDPRIRNALPRQQLLLAFRGETKDRVITLKEGPGGQSTLYYKQKGTGSVQVDPRDLSTTKQSYGLSSPLYCNGLFIIVRGSHIGKLTRRLFGTHDHKWVLQVVRLEPQEMRKIGCTVPRFTEIVKDREPPIVVLESSIALVNQMPDEQGNGIRLMEERQLVAENDGYGGRTGKQHRNKAEFGRQYSETTPPPDTKPSRKRAGRESSLTDEQQAIVESFFPAWEQLLRQHTAAFREGRYEEPKVFLTGDDVRTNDEWAKIDSEGCVQKSPPQCLYQNNINDLVLNALATDEKTKTHQSLVQAAEALLSFKKPVAGKSLFEKENKEEILQLMKKKLNALRADNTANSGDGVSNNHNEHKENKRKENAGAEYQKVLTEMWEKTDQDDYNERAKGIDVNDNQKQFKEAIYSALCALCQNGQLGPCEMMILTGFRDKDNNLVAYKLQAHHNDDDHADAFPVDQDEEMALGNAWKDWCAEYQKVLTEMWEKTDQDDYNERAKGIDVNDKNPAEHVIEPIMPAEELHTLRNANGIPVLGVVDLEQIAPAGLTKVLSDFLHALWNHSWPQDRVRPSIPLVEIEAHPEDFYDTWTFQFPVTLKPVEMMLLIERYSLCTYLSTISAVETVQPFVFWPKQDIVDQVAKREAEAEAARGTGDKIVAHPPSISPPPPKPSAPPAATSLAAILPTNASTLPPPTHGTPIGPARASTAPVASISSPSNASAPPLSTPVTPIGATGASTVPAASISPSKASTPPPSTPAINSERTSIAPPPTPPASTEEGVEAPQQSSGTPASEEWDAVPMLDDQEVSLAVPEAQVVHRSQTHSGKRTIAEITSEVEAPQRVTRTRVAAQEVAPKTRASKKAAGNKRVSSCLAIACLR
ncbi:hypothetical protein BT96DRAFT_949212 [Gymnopus androsaceus JB14]|uniref:Uncharacterized protein n=1 Tax=Gymnopus androsaceus JB14 TaxID=1447944 RepID=A0A6A4GLS8_9AGAR|nr:hypothetical protein BT96DRAFT_949212 [Gymnopus androsaceus JB14]